MNTTSVDAYLADGCGRCALYQTPACKVRPWRATLEVLRAILAESALVEEMKWGAPCYTLGGKNVVTLSALKGFCALSFFKGAALDDPWGVLEPPGPNSRFARYFKFRSVEEVQARRAAIRALVSQAITLERQGIKIEPQGGPEPMPIELEERLAADSTLQAAYDALTPGRRRSHVLYVAGAKQSATRVRRADKCAPKILAGKGFNER